MLVKLLILGLGGSPNLLHNRKMLSTPTPEAILMKLGMSGAPPHMTTLVVVAQRGWSKQICHISEFFLNIIAARHYEIERSRVVLSDILGVGQFGDVFKGVYQETVITSGIRSTLS